MNKWMAAAGTTLFVLAGANAAWPGNVVLDNGTVYRGDIISMDARNVIMKDRQGVEIRIPRPRIRQIGMGKKGGDEINHSALPASQELRSSEAQTPKTSATLSHPSRNELLAESEYVKKRIAELGRLPVGSHVVVKGRYGRIKRFGLGMPQSNLAWYLNDGKHEIEIAGETPSGISSYSRANWGSLIEVKGTILKSNGRRVKIRLQESRVIKRKHSVTPDNY